MVKPTKLIQLHLMIIVIGIFAITSVALFAISSAGPQDPNDPNYPLADTNGDLTVNIFDLSYTLNQWNSNDPTADFNSDGSVNILDLSYLLAQWGRVDEPGGGSVIGACWGNGVGHSGYSPTEMTDRPSASSWFIAEAHSARFVSRTNANLISVRHYGHHRVESSAFYGKGDGGVVEYSVETDDGTSLHAPSGTVIGTTGNVVGAPGLSGSKYLDIAIAAPYGEPYGTRSNFLRYDFVNPVPMQKGQVYHLVTRNTSPDPVTNGLAHNNNSQWRPNGSGLFSKDINRDQHLWDTCPNRSPLDDGVLYKHHNSSNWQLKPAQVSIVEYYFDDGSVQGSSISTLHSNGNASRMHNVDGTAKVRQTMTPTSAKNICSVGIRLARNTTSAAGRQLTIKILRPDGTEVWRHDFPAGTFPASEHSTQPTVANMMAEWAEATTPSPINLQAGTTYYLELSTTSGGSFRVGALHQAPAPGYYHPSTGFSEGKAEYSANGTTWQNFSQTTSNHTGDLSFLFREAASATSCS